MLLSLNENDKIRNRYATVLLAIIWIVLSFFYVGEMILGKRSVSYVLSFEAIVWLPYIILLRHIHKREYKSANYKYMIIISYMLFYGFSLFTSPIESTWCYIFPLIGLIIMFMNYEVIIIPAVIVLIFNVVKYIIGVCEFGYNFHEMINFFQQFFCILLTSCFLCFSCTVLKRYNAIIEKFYRDYSVDEATGIYTKEGVEQLIEEDLKKNKKFTSSLIVFSINCFQNTNLVNEMDYDYMNKIKTCVSEIINKGFEKHKDDMTVFVQSDNSICVFIVDENRYSLEDECMQVIRKAGATILNNKGYETILSLSVGLTDTNACNELCLEELVKRGSDASVKARIREGADIYIDSRNVFSEVN